MNCLPVIEMEMRSASRKKSSFGLRLLFSIVGIATCLVVLAVPGVAPARKGRTMLVLLSFLSLTFCLAAGGFLTADCVSSEKREGTLGLLFLTPLKGLDIVLGKLVCHGLQMFYGMCAVLPVFFLPLLTGGVTWAEVSRIVLALGLALLLSASVGMVVSVLGTESRRTITASLASVVLIAAVPMVYLILQSLLARTGSRSGVPQFSPVFTVMLGFDSNYRRVGGPALFWGSAIALLGLSLILVVISGCLIGRVFRSMGSEGVSSRPRRISPYLAGVLERNPYEWALLRNAATVPSLGVLAYVFIPFFALMLVLSLATRYWAEGFSAAFFTALAIHVVTKLRFAVEATRQIQVDHQSGAMELLLVTTLPEQSILEGHQSAFRMISLRLLFLLIILNAVLELTVILFANALHINSESFLMFTSLFVGGMVLAGADLSALRWLALLKGLKASSHAKAALLTFGSTMLLPWVGFGLTIAWATSVQPKPSSFIAGFFTWITLCLIYDSIMVVHARRGLESGLRRLASEGF
jgi:hypothetical protein